MIFFKESNFEWTADGAVCEAEEGERVELHAADSIRRCTRAHDSIDDFANSVCDYFEILKFNFFWITMFFFC